MYDSLETVADWIYRIFDRRTIVVKSKNEDVRKLGVLDILTGLVFSMDAASEIPFDSIELGKEYFVSLKVYTARKVDDVSPDFIEFFKELDVDQTAEDFIRAYWLYPKYIRFVLVELEQQ